MTNKMRRDILEREAKELIKLFKELNKHMFAVEDMSNRLSAMDEHEKVKIGNGLTYVSMREQMHRVASLGAHRLQGLENILEKI